jgi:hypothetical protein
MPESTTPQQRAASDWLRHLREDRDSRTFFNENALRQAPMFAMKVAEEVAKAYLQVLMYVRS